MAEQEGKSKLHIDSDWKAQAQAEKERLSQQEAEREQKKAGGEGKMPPADFRGLVGLLASQAMMGLGMFGDRESGRVMVDLDGARFNIDLLGVVEEKTKGNLTEEESTELGQILQELRQRYVQIGQLVAQQMAGQGQTPGAESGPEQPNVQAAGRPQPGPSAGEGNDADKGQGPIIT